MNANGRSWSEKASKAFLGRMTPTDPKRAFDCRLEFCKERSLKAFQSLLIIILATLSGPAVAIDDTPENRLVQIERYLEAVPPKKIFEDLSNQIAMNFPPGEQLEFRSLMKDFVDLDVITDAMVESMLKHFTAEELAAIADLYESPVGQSAMSKMGVYMAEVMPVIEAEIMRAVDEFEKKKAERRRTLPERAD